MTVGFKLSISITWNRGGPRKFFGARLYEPQLGRSVELHSIARFLVRAHALRVADPRSGARLCEAQHCPQFSKCPRPIRALSVGNAAAGRRPALRLPCGSAARRVFRRSLQFSGDFLPRQCYKKTKTEFHRFPFVRGGITVISRLPPLRADSRNAETGARTALSAGT